MDNLINPNENPLNVEPGPFNGIASGFASDLAINKRKATYKFTPETARINAAKSAQMRREMRDARKEALKRARANQFKSPESIIIQMAQPVANTEPKPVIDKFNADRLARVRKQLLKLDSMITAACDSDDLDAGHIDKLASAISRLSEIERQLAGRPLPGSLRPAIEKQVKSNLLSSTPTEPTQGQVEQE